MPDLMELESRWPEHTRQDEIDRTNERCGYGPAWEAEQDWLRWWEEVNNPMRIHLHINGWAGAWVMGDCPPYPG